MATPTEQALQGLGDGRSHRPTTAKEYPQGRLLGEPKATRALLQFLDNTSIALPQGYLQRAVERARKDEEWGLAALEEASRRGEG